MLPNLSMLAIDAEQEYKKYTNFVGTGCGYEDTQSTPGGSSDGMSNDSDATYDSDATEQDRQTPPDSPVMNVFVKPEVVDMSDPPPGSPEVHTSNNQPRRRKRCFSEPSNVQRVREILDTIMNTEAQIPRDRLDEYVEKLQNLDTANMESDLKEEIMKVLTQVEQTDAVVAYLSELGKS